MNFRVKSSPMFLIAMLFLFAAAGCSGPVISDITEFSDLHPVSGRATFQGQPIPGATIRFFPMNAAAGASGNNVDVYTGIVGEDGAFTVNTFRAEGRGIGMPAGDYGVCLSWTGRPEDVADLPRDELPEKLPVKYTRPVTSGLKVTVAAGGSVLPDIDLK